MLLSADNFKIIITRFVSKQRIPKVMLLVFYVLCGTLNSNASELWDLIFIVLLGFL